MSKRILALLLTLMLLLGGASGQAAARKGDALIVMGEQAKLSADTGYLARTKGGAVMAPILTLGRLCKLTMDGDQKQALTLVGLTGKRVRLKKGSASMQVDGKPQKLRAKNYLQSKQHLMADVRCLKPLGLEYKYYPSGKATQAAGYPGGVLVVAKEGGSVELPVAGSEALPVPLRADAAKAAQIVGLKYSGGSAAKLTLYEKHEGGWIESLKTSAYVGKNGIDKLKEGDKRTPTGSYALKKPFGIKDDPGAAMGGYLKVTKDHYWSGQPGKYYNKLVNIREVPSYKPSSADEHLIDYKGVYNYCLLIDYNPDGEAGKGSAIFLHCMGSNKYTLGCVAIPEKDMLKLMKTLRSGARMVIY